jgi:hypothetical protein
MAAPSFFAQAGLPALCRQSGALVHLQQERDGVIPVAIFWSVKIQKKPRALPGLFSLWKLRRDQYPAEIGAPPQLKR